MSKYNLISSDQIVAELYQDFNISNTDFEGKIQRHIARGMSIMQVDGFYELAFSFKTIREYIAPLPCDNKYLIAVLHYENGCINRIPLTRSMSLGGVFGDIPIHNIIQGHVNKNYLRTNIEEANIIYVYFRYPKDDAGNLMILDQEDVKEALPYFIIYKLSLSGYVHPVISMERAEAKWNQLYPMARNRANYPSLEEMDRFTKMNNNPLFIDILNEDWIQEKLGLGVGATVNIAAFTDYLGTIDINLWDNIEW